jgi:hypothetical protein
MPNQYVVPQFIDVEDKIIGPVTVRQFLTILVGVGLIAGAYQILFKMANLVGAFVFTAIGIVLLIIMFAFIRVNGRPFHLFLLNLLQSVKTPHLRIWNNEFSTQFRFPTEAKHAAAIPTKQTITQTKLARLALLVDTGGAFHEDEDTRFWDNDEDQAPGDDIVQLK